MGKKSPPDPPDLGPSAAASMEVAKMNQQTAQEQLAWAREQDAANRATLERVLNVQLPIMEQQYQNAQKDRARYEEVFQPLENNLIQEFQSYDSPERRQMERGRAMADVGSAFDAQRRNALQRLEGYGVDPSQTRNAALDLGTRIQQAAMQASAANTADQRVDTTARALRADALNIGRGMPSQVAQSYGQAIGAGQAGIGGANATTGTSAGALTSGLGFTNAALQGYNQNANILTQGYGNQMQQWNGAQQANASAMQGIGSAVGMLAMLADGGTPDQEMYDSEPGKIDYGPGDGSGIDDRVHIMASTGEYIIPADVVKKKGEEFFDKIVDKYHTPAAQQRKQMAQGGRSAIPARNS